jgi:hypothetical protein
MTSCILKDFFFFDYLLELKSAPTFTDFDLKEDFACVLGSQAKPLSVI